MQLPRFIHRPGAVDPISLVALVILIVTLVVGTLVTSNVGRSFEFRRQASEISCNSLSEGNCTGTPGCHLRDVQASCAGKSESECGSTSGCNKQYTSGFVSCGGTPPCNTAARCASQNSYTNCTTADCTAGRSGCTLRAATSGSCSGPSPVCSGRSQTDCNSLHQSLGCNWSGGSGASCTGSYVSGQTCVGPGNTVSTFSGCSGSYVSGKKCEGTPTQTTVPTQTASAPSCTASGGMCVAASSCDSAGRNPASGTCATVGPVTLICCGTLKPTPTNNPHPNATPTSGPSFSCTNAGNTCIDVGQRCDEQASGTCPASQYCCKTPIKPTSPPATPYCTLLVVQDCQAQAQTCTPDSTGGHCLAPSPTPIPTLNFSTTIRSWNLLNAGKQSYCYQVALGTQQSGQYTKEECERAKEAVVNSPLAVSPTPVPTIPSSLAGVVPYLNPGGNNGVVNPLSPGGSVPTYTQVAQYESNQIAASLANVSQLTSTEQGSQQLVGSLVGGVVNQATDLAKQAACAGALGALGLYQPQTCQNLTLAQRSVLSLNVVTFGGLQTTTTVFNQYAATNATANQYGLSINDPRRIVAAVQAGSVVTGFSAAITSPFINPETVAGRPLSSITNNINNSLNKAIDSMSLEVNLGPGGSAGAEQAIREWNTSLDPNVNLNLRPSGILTAEEAMSTAPVLNPEYIYGKILSTSGTSSDTFLSPDGLVVTKIYKSPRFPEWEMQNMEKFGGQATLPKFYQYVPQGYQMEAIPGIQFGSPPRASGPNFINQYPVTPEIYQQINTVRRQFEQTTGMFHGDMGPWNIIVVNPSTNPTVRLIDPIFSLTNE